MTHRMRSTGFERRPVRRQFVKRFWILLVLATGCAEPVQSGGLGVFHPQDFAGRMALVSRLKSSDAGTPEKPSKADASADLTVAPSAGAPPVSPAAAFEPVAGAAPVAPR
ncbi:MAG TPA: hypothetical protein VIV60_07080 [Polyangiaceae bacterium]